MDDGYLRLVLAVCSVILGAAWLWLVRSSRRGRLLPGPVGLPIIGNLHQLGHLPHQTFARFSKTYGPLMCVRLGSVPTLVVSSPSMAMQVLHTLDKTFAGRPLHISAPHIIYGNCPIFFSQPGPYWKLMRHIFISNFFTSKGIEHFRPVRAHEVRALLLSLFASQGSPVSVREVLHTTISNIIARMAIGKPTHELMGADADSESIASLVSEVLYLLHKFNIGDYIPSLAWMDLQGYGKHGREVARKIHSVLQTAIDERRRQRKGSDEDGCGSGPHDLLDLLLSESVNTKHEALHIKDSNIRAVLLDMFAAGIHTSTSIAEWAFAVLLVRPEMLKRVQKELDEKVGTSQIVQESDIPNLPYLRAVINEALRLHATGLVPHMSLEECQISSYLIPANTSVHINTWAIHRDPSVWNNPFDFFPERFLDNTLLDAVPGQHFEFLPFGSGRRSCPGWKLGLLHMQLTLATILQAFDWTCLEGKPQLNETSIGIGVDLPDPLVAIPKPRLPLSLYSSLL